MATSRFLGSVSVTSRSPMRILPALARFQTRDDAQRRRLAAARRAEQHQELARLDAERKRFEDPDRAEAL